jgi:hypothetical protein
VLRVVTPRTIVDGTCSAPWIASSLELIKDAS